MRSLTQFVALSLIASPVLAAIYKQPSALPTLTYDYIVIGGGVGGATIANRLTESNNVTVLVLEAGPSNRDYENVQIPLMASTLARGTVDWGYNTVPQTNLDNRIIPYPRGKVLGGSSSINYMIFNRGSQDDWNYWAKVTGLSTLNWSNMLSIWNKIEHYVPPVGNNPNYLSQYVPSGHPGNGPVQIAMPNMEHTIDKHVIATTQELPNDFPYSKDTNLGNTIGVGYVHAANGGGSRSSSAMSYLGDNYQTRSNLAVLVNAQATKIIQNGTTNGLPKFTAVQFVVTTSTSSATTASSTATTYTVNARKEIIVSAGTFNTPQLLMLSGIGDSAQLSKFGINTIVNNPSVGANMTDHSLLAHAYEINATDTWETYFAPSAVNGYVSQWEQSKNGPLANTVCENLAFLRVPSSDPIFKTWKDPATGSNSGHYEFIWGDGYALPVDVPTSGNYMTFLTQIMSPSSKGSVKLASSNPLDAPLIDPNYYGDAFDRNTILVALKAAKKFMTAPNWKNFVIKPYGTWAAASVGSDADLMAYARNYTATIWHACSTASMSPAGAPWGVVDPNFKVKRTANLRVVDASVIPYVPSTHPMGVIYAWAEVAAATIKASP